MSIWSWLAKLFGGASKLSAQQIQLPVSQAISWTQQQLEPSREQLVRDAENAFAQIRHLLSEISKAALELGQSPSQSTNERVRKIVSSSTESLSDRLQSLCDRLTPPRTADWKQQQSYALESYPLLQKEIVSMRKSLAYSGVLHAKHIKQIGESFGELEEILKTLFERFSKNPFVTAFPRIERHVRNVEELIAYQLELRSSQKELTERQHTQQAQFMSLEKELSNLHESEDAKAYARLQAERKSLEEQQSQIEQELITRMSPVDKPLKRLFAVVEAKTVSNDSITLRPETAQFLSSLVKHPPTAFKSDPSGHLFRELLMELKQAVESGAVSLKESEKQKRLDAIYSLHEQDFFNDFFWNQNKLEVARTKVSRELKALSVSSQLAELEDKISAVSAELKSLQAQRDKIETLLSENESKLRKRVSDLETELSTLSNGPVTITGI